MNQIEKSIPATMDFYKARLKKKESVFYKYKKHKDLLLLFLPGFIIMLIFKYAPIGGLAIAFKDYRAVIGIWESQWVGMEHFTRLFTGSEFIKVVRNTLTISVLKLVIGFPMPIILALLLNEVRNQRFKKLVQTLSYLPYFFSWVVLSGIVTMVFSTRGAVNTLLTYFGSQRPVEFFASGWLFILLLIITSIWQSSGWSAVIYIATITGIDEALYEAAKIDGAGRWRRMISITVPCLIPTIITVFILNLGSIMNAGFDQIYNLYNPAVYEVSDILDTYVLRVMQSMDYSMATAAGLFKSVVALVLVLLSNKIANHFGHGIW